MMAHYIHLRDYAASRRLRIIRYRIIRGIRAPSPFDAIRDRYGWRRRFETRAIGGWGNKGGYNSYSEQECNDGGCKEGGLDPTISTKRWLPDRRIRLQRGNKWFIFFRHGFVPIRRHYAHAQTSFRAMTTVCSGTDDLWF